MARKKQRLEFRYYDIRGGTYVLPLLGAGWEQEYGAGYGRMEHFHNYMEVGYCYHGKGELLIEEQSHVYGDRMFTLIPENVPHTTISAPGNICKWEFLYVDIKSFVKDMFTSGELSPENILQLLNKRGGMILSARAHPVLAQLILQIMNEFRNHAFGYKECVIGYLRALVVEVLRLEEAQEHAEKKHRFSSYMQTAIDYVDQHYPEDINISDMAMECGLSESHFRRVFEENMKMKPVEYINRIRIHAACDLIKSGSFSMEEICYRVGYTTPSTFNRNFRKLMGMPPNQWKKERKDVIQNRDSVQIHVQKGWDF